MKLFNRRRRYIGILRLDPSVTVWTPLPPLRSDAYWDRLWRARVAANETRRTIRELSGGRLPLLLRPQAS